MASNKWGSVEPPPPKKISGSRHYFQAIIIICWLKPTCAVCCHGPPGKNMICPPKWILAFTYTMAIFCMHGTFLKRAIIAVAVFGDRAICRVRQLDCVHCVENYTAGAFKRYQNPAAISQMLPLQRGNVTMIGILADICHSQNDVCNTTRKVLHYLSFFLIFCSHVIRSLWRFSSVWRIVLGIQFRLIQNTHSHTLRPVECSRIKQFVDNINKFSSITF